MKQSDAAIKYMVLELIRRRIKTPEDLALAKRHLAKIYKVPLPSNASLLKTYHEIIKNGNTPAAEKQNLQPLKTLEKLFVTRPIRSLSGIVNISVLTKPYPCPGKCLYCPIEKGVPKSYVSGEPAVERAKKLNYDPYLQVKKRIEMLENEGHPTDKIELRIVGGTWSYYPKEYQAWFITECFRAANEKEKRVRKIKVIASIFRQLKLEQKKNEKAKNRIIGISIETRPDFINRDEIKHLRELGVTMVELGVQSIYDDVLKLNLRGHGAKEIILATKLLKDAGFKVLYQMMLNLPGSNLEKDLQMFKELFSNSDFQPDLLKIYPCALLKEAPLYKLWKSGSYKPYSKKELIDLVKKIKKIIPPYVRIQRITRDIPSQSIVAGPAKISNLRQIIAQDSKREGWSCQCIRCREPREKYNPKEKLYLFRQDYNASKGKEIFLSFENKKRNKIFSLLRLRIPSPDKGIPALEKRAIIRELHTYGQVHSIGKEKNLLSPQHKGLGKKLILEAEKITKSEFGLDKIAVISGVGARDYYRKLDYKLKNTYMTKNL
jgi:elongator complex protein 3